MRLLHLVESTTAGVRRYVTQLIERPPVGWSVEVACPEVREGHFGDVGFVQEMKRLGVRTHFLPLRRAISLQDMAAARALAALLRGDAFDLMHTHSSKAGFIGRIVGRALGVPVIHTSNGLHFLEQMGLKRWFFLNLERAAGRLGAYTIAVSEGEREVMIRHRLISRERLRLIHNGVDAGWVRRGAGLPLTEDLHRAVGLAQQGPLIGAVGRMAPQKDPLTFVRASRRVLTSLPDARFIWCGDGELRPSVERLATDWDIPLQVTGHLENVWPLMARLDVFVLSSLYEGLPFALLEAMALSVPVVATDVVGTRDVLRDEGAGLLAAPRDEAGLAEAICRTLAQPEQTRRRVEEAARLVETRYSLERMLASHCDLYAEVMR